MGTRSSTGFIHKGKYTGVYNQFDGHYGGVGTEVVDTLKRILSPSRKSRHPQQSVRKKLGRFKKRMTALQPVTNDVPPTAEQQNLYSTLGYADLRVSNQTTEDWYCLLRKLQGSEWIEAAYNNKLFHILDGSDFPKDSLFCEYVYAINFDTQKLEIYVGFQKVPQLGNIFGILPRERGEYYPCAKIVEFPLRRIPHDWIERALSRDGSEQDEE